MPLYSDPGYFYSTGTYNAYTPYYGSGISPYSTYGSYTRGLSSAYIIPTTRPTYTSSRYMPKLTPISESGYGGRHSGLTSLTRIHSPKVSYHRSPKYIPPRPITINTADIDVSASKYRKHEKTPEKELPNNSTPSSQDVNNNSVNDASPFMPRVDGNDPQTTRSTIKRDRAVVRLSTMRPRKSTRKTSTKSKSKDKTQEKASLNPEPQESERKSWRENLADLLAKPKDQPKKSPGERLLEKHIIKDTNEDKQETNAADVLLLKDGTEVKLESFESTPISPPVIRRNSVRRVSLPRCPSFHEICEDISSDKIDDDLNAGELRRRASIIQEQEIEIINELQKAGSGIFHIILERDSSQDDCTKSSTKKKSKKGKKVRHKITATVHVDNPPEASLLLNPVIEEASPAEPVSPKPKFSVSVDAIEEDHTVHKVFKLPKKKPKLEVEVKEDDAKSKPETPNVKQESKVEDKIEEVKKVPTKPEYFTFDIPEKSAEEKIQDLKSPTSGKKAAKVEPKPKTPKTPKSPKSPIVKTAPGTPKTKTETEVPAVAKPRPVLQLQKSESGEDFWGQINRSESLYMTNRKKSLLEEQWQKRQDFLESPKLQNCEEVKNLDEIKLKVNIQKNLELEEANKLNSPDTVKRSESANAVTQPKTPKESKVETPKWQKSKLDSGVKNSGMKSPAADGAILKSPPPSAKTPDSASPSVGGQRPDFRKDAQDACDNQKIDARLFDDVMAAEAKKQFKQQNAQEPTSPAESSSKPITTTAPQSPQTPEAKKLPISKINTGGPTSKSPEVKNKQQNVKNVKDQNGSTTAEKSKDTVTKSVDKIKTDADKMKNLVLSQDAEPKLHEIASKQTTTTADMKGDHKKCSALSESGRGDTTETESSKKKPQSPPTPQSPTSMSPSIASDVQVDNDKIRTDHEIGSSKENKKITGSAQNSIERLNEQKQPQPPSSATDVTTSGGCAGGGIASTATIDKKQTIASASTPPSIPQSPETTLLAKNQTPAKKPQDSSVVSPIADNNRSCDAKISDAASTESAALTSTSAAVSGVNAAAAKKDNPSKDDDIFVPTESGLTKFRTVADLNRCLLDVDAELSDYHPSEDDSSSEEDDSSETDSDTANSMKKKAKQQKKKDKEKKFDPKKNVKLDHSKKCYVNDEAPPYPLIATPRPLWKREKFNYTNDSESDSEETDSDSECSSDEYSDELNPSGLTSLGTSDVRMSTCSNDSGFEGGTAPTSPKKMLETSYTFAQFQRSGRMTAPATTIPRFKKYSVEDFHFLAVLGKGSFGKVLLAELRNTDYYYAVKCLKKDVVLEDDDVECTLIERKVLALGTKHPYLCHLFCTFQTESHLFFVMEYLNGGDLMFHIQQSGRFPEPRARFYAAEIISGLKFLHKKGIIYRDLKLDNVLLDFDGHVRIADFGMCKLQIYLDKTADSFCGTPDYMAPEIIKGEKYTQSVDWWSFGVLMYEMLIGQSPFSGCDEDELFWSICNEIPWFPIYVTKEAHNLLKGLLSKDQSVRMGSQYSPAGDICSHPFFNEIDWGRLERRAMDPPFKPQVKHPLDTQYFDKAFTKERVRLTPIDKDILQSMDQAQFQGFSYTNPNATLT